MLLMPEEAVYLILGLTLMDDVRDLYGVVICRDLTHIDDPVFLLILGLQVLSAASAYDSRLPSDPVGRTSVLPHHLDLQIRFT